MNTATTLTARQFETLTALVAAAGPNGTKVFASDIDASGATLKALANRGLISQVWDFEDRYSGTTPTTAWTPSLKGYRVARNNSRSNLTIKG